MKRDICSHLLQRQSNTSAGQIKWPNLILVWLGGEGGGCHGGGAWATTTTAANFMTHGAI